VHGAVVRRRVVKHRRVVIHVSNIDDDAGRPSEGLCAEIDGGDQEVVDRLVLTVEGSACGDCTVVEVYREAIGGEVVLKEEVADNVVGM